LSSGKNVTVFDIEVDFFDSQLAENCKPVEVAKYKLMNWTGVYGFYWNQPRQLIRTPAFLYVGVSCGIQNRFFWHYKKWVTKWLAKYPKTEMLHWYWKCNKQKAFELEAYWYTWEKEANLLRLGQILGCLNNNCDPLFSTRK
jgi:predicted GIY-YIG superfamily endonuclease